MIQDTIHIAPNDSFTLGLQQILIALWAIFSVVLVPLTWRLIETLKTLNKSTTTLSFLVLGVEENGTTIRKGLVADYAKQDEMLSDIVHTLNQWITVFKNTDKDDLLGSMRHLDWTKSPRYQQRDK